MAGVIGPHRAHAAFGPLRAGALPTVDAAALVAGAAVARPGAADVSALEPPKARARGWM